MAELIENLENSLIKENKRGKGRLRKYEEVLAKERNKETMKELSEKGYFKNYYKSKSASVNCEYCNKKTNEFCLKQHQNTKKCLKIRADKETEATGQVELIDDIKEDLIKDILCDEIKNDFPNEKSFIVYFKVINL